MIDPIELPPRAAADMMIDIDHGEAFETAQAGALERVAFKQNRGVVGTVNAHGRADSARARQGPIDCGNAVGGD
jgi:hypothetical protein